jgi:hypothetical protein
MDCVDLIVQSRHHHHLLIEMAWFMVFNSTLDNISVYRGGQRYLWREPEYPEKAADLSQVTDKLDIVSSTP